MPPCASRISRAYILTPGKKKIWIGSGKKAGVQNGEKRLDKRKTHLTQQEYFVFHVLNLCPPDDIMVNTLCDYQYLLMQITVTLYPIRNQ
jgi:hypothetical protein